MVRKIIKQQRTVIINLFFIRTSLLYQNLPISSVSYKETGGKYPVMTVI